KLGYKSYKDLYDDLIKSSLNDMDISSVSPEEDTVETNEKLYRSYDATLKEVMDYNPVQTIDIIVDRLYLAEKVFCFGAQSSNILAKLFTNRLLEIGIEAYNSEDNFVAISLLKKMKKNDVAFFVSSSGESTVTNKLARFAKQQGVTLITITGIQDNTLKRMSDYSLCCPEFIIYTNFKSITNRCSQLFLIDCIYLNLWKKDPERHNKSIRELDDITRPEFGGLPLLPDEEFSFPENHRKK
ncbi:MurR/RpiR family transcriptional regulator, partial [Holdemania massiliensis]